MVDFLSRCETLVEIGLSLGMSPKHIPIVSISAHEAVKLQYEPDQLWFTLQHLVETELCRSWSLVVWTISREKRLLITYALNSFDQLLVYLYGTAILALHHLENFEFYEMVVGDTMFIGQLQAYFYLVIKTARVVLFPLRRAFTTGSLTWRHESAEITSESILSYSFGPVWILSCTLANRVASNIEYIPKNINYLLLRIHFVSFFLKHENTLVYVKRGCSWNAAIQNVYSLPRFPLRRLLKLQLLQHVKIEQLILGFALFCCLVCWTFLVVL